MPTSGGAAAAAGQRGASVGLCGDRASGVGRPVVTVMVGVVAVVVMEADTSELLINDVWR